MKRFTTWICNLSLLCAASIGSHGFASEYQSLGDIRQAATEFARSTLSMSGVNDSIEAGHLDPRLRLKKCELPLTASQFGKRSNGNNMTVVVKCNSSKPWTVYVPVKAHTYVTVAVAKQPLARGIPISKDDIVFEQREVSHLTAGYYGKGDNLLGRIPKRTLTKGSVVSPRDMHIKKVVSKGNRVSILAETNGIAVRMPGQALADAGKGEQVKVQNLSSKRTVIGTVIGPGLVKVGM